MDTQDNLAHEKNKTLLGQNKAQCKNTRAKNTVPPTVNIFHQKENNQIKLSQPSMTTKI